jgi:predicted DNA-binding protein
MINKLSVHLSIDIPKEVNDQLKDFARNDGRSVKSLLRKIIQEYVDTIKGN